MNRKEAAEYLGVSVRSIDSYIAKGKIGVRYERSNRGRTAILDINDLEELKQSLNTTIHKPRTTEAPTIIHREAPALPTHIQIEAAPTKNQPLLLIDITAKSVLRIKEAAQVSGFSESFLKAELLDGSLRGKKIRGAWRIHRKDLDQWLDKLLDEAM